MVCRFCKTTLTQQFVDLGSTPLANSYLNKSQLDQAENRYPLTAFVCNKCLLVQIEEFETPEQIFSQYAYFSSYSDTWLAHCREYAETVPQRFGMGKNCTTIEIASNDGCLLGFLKEQGLNVLGIEPAANVAAVAEDAGIPTLIDFFGTVAAKKLAAANQSANLLIANNVLAHVTDLNDFVEGMRLVLADDGVITIEFPHLMQLIANCQFDTIYHEHFSYFSLHSVEQILSAHSLRIFDVEELDTHGGSLRLYVTHDKCSKHLLESHVKSVKLREHYAGMNSIDSYLAFHERVTSTRDRIVTLLNNIKQAGHTIVAYGAAAKGNTLLNYCQINADIIEYAVDRSPHKQGHWMPGSRIPIFAPERIAQTKPAYLFILPWNIKEEIISQMSFIREWGGQFIVPIPEPGILP